ncbi:dihydroxyacetone kinase subunit DhaL [Escherichia coli]|uniref:Dihydroxyacetone kinase subunit DhaL n=1 Tax=Escherichia coli TaxID=562 RepID=A0A376KVG2_ECOLX|nr:dihydroxyacetone kinase subunit DhaL [Escherichia coli]
MVEKLPAIADKDIGFILKNTGMTLLSSVGGASGPLFGTFFIRAAQATQARQKPDTGRALSDVSAMAWTA